MNWQDRLRASAAEVPPDEVPDLIAELARQDLLARARHAAGGELLRRRNIHANGLRHFKAEEVAELLGVTKTWVRRHRDELGAVTLTPGGAVRYPENGLKRFLKRVR